MGDEKLIRDQGGSYHSEDGRFSVENDGRWNVRDEQGHDELGLPRVLGPFATLDAARGGRAEAGERKIVKLRRRRRWGSSWRKGRLDGPGAGGLPMTRAISSWVLSSISAGFPLAFCPFTYPAIAVFDEQN